MRLLNEHHTFTGMQKDLAESKHPQQYLCDAKNIRLTQREDGNTLLAITNEKGTTDTNIAISGTYLGHCLLNKYLVIFSTDKRSITPPSQEPISPDYIYRIDLSSREVAILYEGNLDFKPTAYIECLGSYETEAVQKVYWTDGINPPRVINIVKYDEDGQYYSTKDIPFDFVPSLSLSEVVKVTKLSDSGGIFPPGMIQYAFTYYNKYGQESNIFYTSELHAVSPRYRGGNPEDKVSNSFKIEITEIDDSSNRFDFLRIYSILRTSEEGEVQVKRVADIPLYEDTTDITFIDTGTIGDAVDPSLLLYIGGEEIIAQTMAAKDGTLFFGDIEIKRKDINSSLRESIKTHSGDIDFDNTETVDIPEINSSSFYTYHNNIDIPPFYKIGEHYRFGIQFQHISGRWSMPVVLNSDLKVMGSHPTINNGRLTFTVGKTTLDTGDIQALRELGYIKARGLVVLPTLHDRLIFTQGALCPTVFNTEMRTANAPFAMSSWFARPDSPNMSDINNIDGRYSDVEKYGNYLEYRQQGALIHSDWRGEIDGYKNVSTKDSSYFGVDRSILTMHSPDIEFDPNITDSSYSGWKLRLIGRALLTSSASDVDIQTETPAKESYYGFKKISFISGNAGVKAGRSLISAPMWEDSIFKSSLNGETAVGSKRYMIYPWQRQGSLNNDSKRPDSAAQTALLKKKKMSILRYCENTVWHDNTFTFANLSSIGVFDSNQVELNFIGDTGGSTYYGNVDTLLGRGDCNIYYADRVTEAVDALPSSIDGTSITWKSIANVRMKYKSGKHLFFSLGTSNDSTLTLPIIGDRTETTHIFDEVPWKVEGKEPDTTVETQAVPIYAKGQYQNGDEYARLYELYQNTKPDVDDLILLSDGLSAEELTVYKIDSNWVEETQQRPTPGQGQILVQTIVKEYVVVNPLTMEEEERDVIYYTLASPLQQLSNYYACVIDNYAEYYEADHQGNILIFLYRRKASTQGTTNVDYTVNKYYPSDDYNKYSYYWIGELYRDSVINAFGGDTEDAYKGNVWIPAGEPVTMDPEGTEITFRYGDTYYQRYDCLKTYAFTNEDENSVIDIFSFMCESRVNADGRYDKNRGKASNLMMSPLNFNLYNQVYSQKNNFFSYRILNEEFYTNSHFPNQITWTKEKQAGAETDLWTNITLASTYDIDGRKGKITSLNTWKDQIFCFQDKGISTILFNSRVQIPTSDGVPIEISNNYKVDGYKYISDGIGCSNKWTIKETPAAVYFIDSVANNLYSVGDGFTNITLTKNMNSWFKSSGASIKRVLHDNVHHDVYLITSNTALCYNELLGEFTSFMDYEDLSILESYYGDVYSMKGNSSDKKLYKMFSGPYNYFFNSYKPWNFTFISNGLDSQAVDFDKVFSNIDYRLDFFDSTSYNPDESFDFVRVWNEYQDTQEVTLSQKNDGKGYKTAKFYKGDNPQKKFRIWRIQIPRAKRSKNGQYVATNDRIRNPWCKITLGKKNNDQGDLRAVLHDLNVQYYI